MRRGRKQHRTPGRPDAAPAEQEIAGSLLKFAAGTLALAPVVWPAGTAAQCISGSNPPPTATVSSNFANQSFGNNPPLAPFPAVGSGGLGGCGGSNGGDDQNGGAGGAGQPAGAVNSTGTGLTIIGAPYNDLNPTTAASIGSAGGTGGNGGTAGNAVTGFTPGGNGGNGGAGGQVTVAFEASFQPDPATGLASYPLYVSSNGGSGGWGGGTSGGGAYGKYGGDGGTGGAGGGVTITASGTFIGLNQSISAGAAGGYGGDGGPGDSYVDLLTDATGGNGATGGGGGTVAVTFTGGAIQSDLIGIFANAPGGGGGNGGQATNATGLTGGNAGAGGAGGIIGVTLSGGTITVNEASGQVVTGGGILVQANGGNGGQGGLAGATLGSGGGTGGAGGNGGSASATILGGIVYNGLGVTGQADGQAVSIQANGGLGGAGGGASGFTGGGGSGGLAGAGGSAVLTLGNQASQASIRTTGNFAHGALVQSIGGGGGNGGSANFVFGGSGGNGAAGGNGGAVSILAPAASVITASKSGVALLAQSVGGGGGIGGDVTAAGAGATFVIGGTGGLGGNGGSVRLDLSPGVFASTSTLGGAGILAQSIGGSGGSGGSASASGVGLISMAIGGNGGSGGEGGQVSITSGALITTFGDHAAGIQAQSIGGGGGKGGSAVSFSAGIVPTAAVSIGGTGGGGGGASAVNVVNTAQVTTYGADAHGVLIQSIGGGGGSGGSAAARAVDITPDRRIPAISVSVATGGSGGSGNTGNTAALTNSGLITTAGDGSIGVMAQSIGGGGGTGGDSTAASYSGGNAQGGLTVSIAVSVGGAGGDGGRGGPVTLANSGLITTLGQDAYGVFAQSVGGGGGTGGGGDATSNAQEAKFSFSSSLALGGRGGSGGTAGGVGLTNTGAITTSGDGSDGVFAQSIGGGGGSAGGGTATASGGNVSLAVGVGGIGGAGGDGNAITIHNTGGAIVTRGTDAVGIFAQSVGGGGGKGGKGGATAGGVSPLSNLQALTDILSSGLNFGQSVTRVTDQILQIGQIGENIQATVQELQGILQQPQAQGDGEEGESDSISVQVNVGVAVAGRGGGAGNGSAVGVTNTGQVVTFGAQSDGILAQSIGGGGGSGGAASSVGSASDDTPVQASVAVGGGGGSGGNGGNLTVTNGTGGQILTQGVLAMGIVAQSIGGGGGEGSIAGTVNGSLKSLGVGVGGNGAGGGDGGMVSVTTGDGTAGSTTTTTGKHGIGILAQSIGGGGGLVRTMTTDQTFDPSKILSNPQGRIADIQGFSLDLGGQNGAGGYGGPVQVNVAGPVTTSGLGAHAVVAQSIGGGGGFVAGGQFLGPVHAGGDANRTGDGGNVTIGMQAGGAIETAGDGAYGILAQSIGGGGGVAGDPSQVGTYVRDIPTSVQRSGSGSGGAVSLSATGATIRTTGAYAPAIFAQTVGGGGGMVSQGPSTAGRTLFRGSTGGSGNGGSVTVALVGSQFSATGAGSAGILAQSTGQSTGAIQISLDASSSVTGGQPDADPAAQDRTQRDAAAIRLLGGTANTITNAGRITALNGNGVPGYAILADSSRVTVTNTGTITGDISVPTGGAFVDNREGGVIAAPTAIDLGDGGLRNAGALQVGGAGVIGRTILTGNLVQPGTGRLVIDADLATGSADRLDIRGNAVLGGTVEVRPVSIANAAVTVLTATDGLTLDPALAATRSHLFRFDLQAAGGALQLRPAAEFVTAEGALGTNRRRVAAHLQELWDSGVRFDAGFTALGGVADGGGYARALDTLSGQTVGAIAASRYSASHSFVSTMLDGCPTYNEAGVTDVEQGCGWARIIGRQTDQNATGGALGYRADAWTMQTGAQVRIAPNWFAGGSIAYESSDFRGDGGIAKVNGDSLLLGATLRYQNGPWQFSGAVDFGRGWYDSRRTVQVGDLTQQANANPTAWQAGLHTRVAYQIPFEGWYLQPRLDLHVNHVRSGGYTENGAGPFNLTVDGQSETGFAATPAMEVGARVPLSGGMVLRPYASAGLSLLSNGDWTTTARFAGQPNSRGFRASTPMPDTLGRFSVGAELLSGTNWDFKLQYSADIGDGYASHAGVGRIAYRF